MKKLTLILFLFPIILFAQQKKPKLVVGIVVDQMRYDYLERYWDRFEEDGFKKLINGGFNCKNTHYNYMPTYTAPGHASIYAGTTPENHGIISNSWYDKLTNTAIYCTGDMSAMSVGSSSIYGQMSPHRLLGTTITDELKLATNLRGKVIGISIKDRGAILPAGHKADAAYWFEGGNLGAWISSSYYMQELPDWVKKINKKKPAEKFLSQQWNTLYPIDTYKAGTPDDNPHEGLFVTEKAAIFPHNLPALRDSNQNYELIKSTPFGNTILKELALAALKEEKLGQDNFTDFLAISFSSTDYVGHQFGPMSIEIEDTYLRLDKEIAELLTYLETEYGKDEVLVFLTADHGVVNIPQYLIDLQLPAGYFDIAQLENNLNAFLKAQYNTDQIVKNVSNFQVFLNRRYIKENNWNIELIENAIADFVISIKGVAKVVTASSLKSTEFTDRILANAQRGYHQARSGDVLFVLESGWIPTTSKTGTTHGSPYHYDTHVPLLWYGNGIKKGETDRQVIIPDIAATLAQLLGIQAPSACTGEPIHDLFKK